ncbi:unnamed protein product [Ectocarpus sp. 8 AP-2014]
MERNRKPGRGGGPHTALPARERCGAVVPAASPAHHRHPGDSCEREYSETDLAKLSIAPGAKLEDWMSPDSDTGTNKGAITVGENCVVVGIGAGRKNYFRDNVERIPGSVFADDVDGDTLPHLPTVLTGFLDEWPAYASREAGKSWSLRDLVARTAGRKVSLDGGPSFARMSMCAGSVSLAEYERYSENESGKDSAPLYVFDPSILGPRSTFCDDGSLVRDAFDTPACFSRDAAAAVCDEKFRPLPPKWLLVGAVRSGTSIHDHPTTVAWNALLVGCKLWCCFPPDVDESALLLNLDGNSSEHEGGGEAFDLSALEWFCRAGSSDGEDPGGRRHLHKSAKVIIQRPGEVVFLPIGWFHVVLNVEASTALSMSLTLRRDLPSVLPLFLEAEREFALWGRPNSDLDRQEADSGS